MYRKNMGVLRSAASTLAVLAVASVALLAAGRAGAQTTSRPIADFISTQGTTVNWWPPVADYLGWGAARTNAFALVDYAGIANDWLKANGGPDLGTQVTGSVFETALGDGRAEVHVNLITTSAHTIVSAQDPWGQIWFGDLAPDVATGATPALGSCSLSVVFCNTAPGAPLPNLVEAMVLGNPPAGFEMKSISFMAEALGALKAEAGLGPDGTSARATVAQMGMFTPTDQNGVWPIECVMLELAPVRQNLRVWTLPRTIAQGASAYLRTYVRKASDLSWVSGLMMNFTLDGTPIASAPTDANGRASALFSAPAGWALGAHSLVCNFPGNATWLPASGSATITSVP